MSKIKILIVEDDPLFVIDLQMLIDELDYELVGVVDNSDDVFKSIKKSKPNIVLMDIHIKGMMDGIEIAEKLKNEKIAIIFITSFQDKDTFEKAKKITPYGYLVKPFNQLTLESIIEYAVSTLNIPAEDRQGWSEDIILENFVFIKRNNQLDKVEICKIEFIQSEGNYCVISTKKKKYALKMSLRKVEKVLDSHAFMRINKRHLVNMDMVNSIDLSTNKLLINDQDFSIGRTYKEGFLRKLKKLS